MGKYKFRKMYFVCEDKKVINHNVHMTAAYQIKETADSVCKDCNLHQRDTLKPWADQTKPAPNHTVEAFYLVPERLYEEILKMHTEGD